MRINKFVALASGLSRRAADKAIGEDRVLVNGSRPQIGQEVSQSDEVKLDHRPLAMPQVSQTIMLNKPVGYVVSRDGQGSSTIYDLLPPELHHLKPVGRLDKDSSGLLLLTNDGQLANQLTHPRYQKTKVYEVTLDKPLTPEDKARVEAGLTLEDGLSSIKLQPLKTDNRRLTTRAWLATLSEGKNRQIRRTFTALGYTVTKLHRTQFGPYFLEHLTHGHLRSL